MLCVVQLGRCGWLLLHPSSQWQCPRIVAVWAAAAEGVAAAAVAAGAGQ